MTNRVPDIDSELHFLLLRAFHHVNQTVVARTRALGLLPGQPKILEYLAENDGCRARDICDGCCQDKSTMTSLLARMERDGVVRREEDPGDRRASRVFLTAKGRGLAMEVKRIVWAVDDETCRGLGAAEIAGALDVLRKLSERSFS